MFVHDWWAFLVMCATLHGHLDDFEDTYSQKLVMPTTEAWQELVAALPPTALWEQQLLAHLKGIALQAQPVDWATWWPARRAEMSLAARDGRTAEV